MVDFQERPRPRSSAASTSATWSSAAVRCGSAFRGRDIPDVLPGKAELYRDTEE